MYKFLYTIIFANLAALGMLIRLVLFNYPNELKIKLIFLFLVGTVLFLTISITIFFLNKRKTKSFFNPKLTYRKGLKTSLIFSLGITGLLALKIFALLNLLTGSLLFLVFLTGLIAATSNKR